MPPFEHSRATAGGLLGDSLLRIAGDAKDADLNLARQQVIWRLLRQVPMSVAERSQTVMMLLQCGILTQEAFVQMAWGAARGAEAGVLPVAPQLQGALALPSEVLPAAMQGNGGAPTLPASQELSLVGTRPRFEQDFERLELLGRGAFGEVWRCRHRVDGQEYAIKAVRYQASAADIAEVERRALREAKTWASISHPNIARYHNSWVEVEWEPHSLLDSTTLAQFLPPRRNRAASSFEQPRICEVAPVDSSESEVADPEGSVTYAGDESESDVVFGEPSGSAGTATSLSGSPPVAALAPIKATHVRKPVTRLRKEEARGIMLPTHACARRPGFGANNGAAASRGNMLEAPRYRATLYIQAELCSKETLFTWIANKNAALTSNSTTPEESAQWARQGVNIFRQCAVAIAHLHKHRCAHRDIKPSNIYLSQDGNVRIGDFGLARAAEGPLVLEDGSPDTSGGRSLPQALSSGVGTPSYSSPEQLRGGPYGVETDIYALGVVLTELISPVGTHMERAVLLEDLRHHRRLPSQVVSAFPVAAQLALAMTHPERAKRPSAGDILKELGDAKPELMALPGTRATGSTTDATPAVAMASEQEDEEETQQSSAALLKRPWLNICRNTCSFHCRARSRRIKLARRQGRVRAC
mmetsp:Transcript_26901/g.68347  ORF Transcript_26901/g.68347 Transcript_26901/m.68347 type:complete len:643 (+) Transcript_26901:64-1992(+)